VKPDLEEAVTLAVTVFQEHAGADDDRIERELLARGVDPALAVRLIQFLPIAFCRVFLRLQGVKFPDHYIVMGPRGVHVGTYPIDQEPVYVHATAAAERELEAGRGGAPFLAVAGRSAAFNAVMKLVQDGSALDGIMCSPPILQAQPEDAPTPERAGWRWPWQRGK
jgi:hypothetical protein